jgi:hypothetical protein
MKMGTITKNQRQATIRQQVNVGPKISQVSPLSYWIGQTILTPEGVLGAFELSYQQCLDGMGESLEQWTGLTSDQIRLLIDPETRYETAAELVAAKLIHAR